MRYLGIDYGSKKVGLAVSDEGGKVAFPFKVIPSNKKLLFEIAAICEQEGIGHIVCGLSVNSVGHTNPIAADAKSFCDLLMRELHLPLDFENEFLTSVLAGEISPRDKELDARAAALILQRYLDRQKN